MSLVRQSSRLRPVALLSLLSLAALSACQDKRVKAVDTGISRDSALSVMTKDAAAPVVATGANAAPVDKEPPNVYRRDQYLVNGVSTEVLYFDSKNRHLGQIDKDTVPWKDLTPVVMVNNKVMGKGWDFWDDLAKRNKLPMHKH